MTRYTAGFALTDNQTQVFLVGKLKGPPHLVGKHNAIGGKIEPGETSAEAQAREFLEEAGVAIPWFRWKRTVILQGIYGWEVEFFITDLTPEEAHQVKTMEDEPISLFDVADILAGKVVVVPNIRWILPLSMDEHIEHPVRATDKY